MRAEYEREKDFYPRYGAGGNQDIDAEFVGCRDCGGTELGCVRCCPERFL